MLPCLIPLAAASPEDTTRQAGNLISNRRNQRAQPYKFKGQRVAGCLFRGAAELKFCLTPKGTAVKCIWQHAAENPRVVASASFHDCKKATFKFHMCRTPRGCPGRLRRLLPFGLRWHKQSQAWQLHVLSCTCELQSSWASAHRRPPGDRNPSAHISHVAFKGGGLSIFGCFFSRQVFLFL